MIHGTESPKYLDKYLSLKGKLFGSSLKKRESIARQSDLGAYNGKYFLYTLQWGYKSEYESDFDEKLYDFRWGYESKYGREKLATNDVSVGDNGPLSSFAREEAGKALYLLVFDYCEKNKIMMQELELCIFAFSHGGNVAAEFLNEVKRQKNNELKTKQLFFFETPKTEQTERAIHQKSADGKSYIAEHILDINISYPKDKTQIMDFTASFPCCARQFLFARKNLFEFFLMDRQGYAHNDIMNYFFLKKIKCFFDNYLEKDSSSHDYGFKNFSLKSQTVEQEFRCAEKICSSKDPLRWLLYYRKILYSLFFYTVFSRNGKKLR